MADEETPVGPKPNRINVRNASFQRSTFRDAGFTRADIQTGEIKSIEGDILNDILGAITDQTQTLSQSFKKSIDDCCQELLKRGRAGGGAGGGIDSDKALTALESINDAIRGLGSQIGGVGGAEGGDPGTVAQARRVQALSNAIENLGFNVDETNRVIGFKLLNTLEEFEEQLRENVNETIRELNASIIKAVGSFTRWSAFADEALSRFNKGLDLASSGMADFGTMFGEDTLKVLSLGFRDTGDSLQRTAEQIRTLADDITSPLRLVQGGVRDVAVEFKRLREEAEDFGLDLFARVGFEEQNKLLVTLIDEQRRGSLQDDFRSFETRQLAMQQLDFLSMVADNTGKSLEVLLQQQKETAKTFEELQALGIINQEEADTFKMMSSAFPQQSEFLQKIAASGGDMSVFARKFPDLFQDLQAMGASDIINEIGNLSRSGLTGSQLANEVVEIMQGSLAGASERFGSAAAAIMFEGREIQGLIGATNQMTKFQDNIGESSVFVRTWNKFGDFFTNTFPIQWAKSIGALGFNTMAIIANTLAHLKGAGLIGGALRGMKGILGSFGRVMGIGGAASAAAVSGGGGAAATAAGGAGIMSKITPALGGIAKLAGGVGVGLAAGKDVIDLARGDTSGENVGALIGTAIGGAIGLLAGPGGAIVGAGLGNLAGEWIGGKVGGTSLPTPKNPSFKPRGPAGTTRPGGTQAVAMHMARQTELLASISTKMDMSIAVQGEIASGIDKIGFDTRMTVGEGRTRSPSNIQVFAESPSMGSR